MSSTAPRQPPPSRVLSGFAFVSEAQFTEGAEDWGAVDDMGVELETAELLWALARAVKPTLVVEVGCWPGVATDALARALEDNGRGRLVTYEANYLTRAQLRFGGRAEVRRGRPVFDDADLVFIDGNPNHRRRDLEAARAQARPGALIAVHDTARWGPRELAGAVRIGVPRGLALFHVDRGSLV